MKIGSLLPQNDDECPGAVAWPRIRDLARHAEDAGLDSLWVYDHLVFRGPADDGSIEEDGIHEAWTLLAAIAAVTGRVELGTIVLGTGFRPPALLAKMAATLDEVAGGRLTLGLGTGWYEPEYRAFGYPFDHRAGRFDEALQVIVPLLRGERVSLDGAWYQVDDAVLLPPPPRPARRPGRLPILVAARGERVLRLTARHADAWNTAWYGLPDERYAQRHADLLAACAAEGRDPATLEVTVGIELAPAGDGDGGASRSRPFEPVPADVSALARAFDAWRDLGVGHLQVAARPVDERALDLLAGARRLHLGEA